MLSGNKIDGYVEVYNNLGEHWIKVFPLNTFRVDDIADRLHKGAIWKIQLKKVPANDRFWKETRIFYDSFGYSSSEKPFLIFLSGKPYP